ncbi:cell division protein FtsK, partial [Streptomyces sp. NPDC059956]
MPLLLTVVDAFGHAFDVHLDADPETPVAAIAEALAAMDGTALPMDGSGLHFEGVELPPEMSLRESPLRDGAVVGLGRSVSPRAVEPRGLVEVRAVGGPGAGAVHRLDIGEYRIGLAADGTPLIARPGPGRPALALRVGPGGRCRLVQASPTDSSTMLQIDREDVDGEQDWPIGAQLRIGDCLLELLAPERADAALQPSEDGAGWDYNRPPRLLPPKPETRFALPSPPTPPAKRPLPYIAAILPLVMAGAGVLIFGRLSMLLFGLLSPLAIVGNYWTNKRSGRETHATSVANYEEKKARIEADAEAALIAERTARRHGFPDPAAVLLTAVGPRRRLWERRTSDDDFLELRVGTADQASDVVLQDPTQDEHRRKVARAAYDVPVTVALRTHKVFGIAGRGAAAAAVARWAVAQAAVLHSPRDLH